jgi:hypothetical protein
VRRVVHADGWGDEIDRRGPRVSGTERVNGRATLTGRTHQTEREKGKRARASEGIGTDRQDPRAERERGQRAREHGLAGADRGARLVEGECGRARGRLGQLG